jgi:hypothetical protein
MGLFTNLFASKAPEQPSSKKELVYLMGAAKFELEITGGEQYQSALEVLCGARVPRGVNLYETASLKLDDKTPQAKHAVRVEIRGKQVGYLSPEAASLFRQQLMARGMPKGVGQCAAVIRGGWISSDGRKGPYEVWLDFPTWIDGLPN